MGGTALLTLRQWVQSSRSTRLGMLIHGGRCLCPGWFPVRVLVQARPSVAGRGRGEAGAAPLVLEMGLVKCYSAGAEGRLLPCSPVWQGWPVTLLTEGLGS